MFKLLIFIEKCKVAIVYELLGQPTYLRLEIDDDVTFFATRRSNVEKMFWKHILSEWIRMCWLALRIYFALTFFSHIATWKQEIPNLWNYSGETGNWTPDTSFANQEPNHSINAAPKSKVELDQQLNILKLSTNFYS